MCASVSLCVFFFSLCVCVSLSVDRYARYSFGGGDCSVTARLEQSGRGADKEHSSSRNPEPTEASVRPRVGESFHLASDVLAGYVRDGVASSVLRCSSQGDRALVSATTNLTTEKKVNSQRNSDEACTSAMLNMDN